MSTGPSSGTATQENNFSAAEDARSGLKRDIGPVGLLFAGVGSIIGSGWLFGAFNASSIAGPNAIFAWVLGSAMIMLIGLVYAELGPMFPVSGGVARFPHFSFGSFASYSLGWVTWLAAAVVAPIEVLGAITYASSYASWLTYSPHGDKTQHLLTWPQGYLVAAAGMLLFSFINLVGVRWFARLNNVIVWWKLAIIVATIVAFFVAAFHTANFSQYGFAPTGGQGMVHSIVVSGIIFSFLGFRQGVELGGETDKPGRNIPLAVIGSIAICAVIYILLQIAYIGAVRPSDLAHSHGWANLAFTNDAGPLAAIAGFIGLTWLSKILLADAVISPADTGLIYTTVTARLSYAMGRNGNAPRALAKTSSRGVPWLSVAVAFVMGLIIFLPFPSWNKLVGFVTNATVLSFGSGSLVWAAMRRQIPDHPRPFRLPGGELIPFLAFYSANLMVYWAGWDLDWKLFAAVGIGLVLLAVQWLFVPSFREQHFHLRNGWWVMLWFAGLAVISWQGSYSSDDGAHGQQNNIGFGWAFVILFVWSVVIYWLALRSRLSPEDTRAQIAQAQGAVSADPLLAEES
ncbi:MAG TPA: APC family permease [Mycobacteriales bacterium]|jgi:amino acid transporter|nr:APC family permease [Mycobacteriales bacterium]